MYPELVNLALTENINISISSYRFFGLLAALYLAIMSLILLGRLKINNIHKAALIIIMVASFFLGARLLYTILYLPGFLNDPLTIFYPGLRNFTLFGGLFTVLIVWWLYTRKQRISFARSTDYLAPHLGISLAIMRVGCFLNGCCYGKVTEMPWGVRFPFFSLPYLSQLTSAADIFSSATKAVHPTQLYELAAALAATLAAWLIFRKTDKAGVTTAVFALVLSLGRLITFYFREFPLSGDISDFVRGPVVYSLVIAFSLGWIIKNRIYKKL